MKDFFFQSFERVLVQNILHGLSPSLCEAIQKIPRLRMIEAAFPHVMMCCSSLLNKRKQNCPESKFGNSETKLLYTLHWIILDSVSECEDNEMEQNGNRKVNYTQPLASIQLFVYLFAPLINSLKPSDFKTLKLEHGALIWEPLWDHVMPDVPCFSSPVKPKRTLLRATRRRRKMTTNVGDIYLGNGSFDEPESPRGDGIFMGDDKSLPSPVAASPTTPDDNGMKAPLASISEVGRQ